MTPLVLVHGTHGRSQPWHWAGSPLPMELGLRGFIVFDFLWSGILAGVPTTLPGDPRESITGADQGALLPWLDAGEKLRLYCQANGLECPSVICHSHGLQVVTYAAARGQRFSTVLSLSGPVRRDLQRARRAASGRITRWVQVTDPTGKDRTILEGEAFDGHVGWHLELPEATYNLSAPGQGHSGLTMDVGAWEPLGLWAALAD